MMQFTLTKDTNPNDSLLASFDIATLGVKAELRYVGSQTITNSVMPNQLVLVVMVPPSKRNSAWAFKLAM